MTSRSSGSERRRRAPRAKAGPAGSRAPSGGGRPDAGGLEAAKALALRVLAFHARSEAQLRARLARSGHAGVADEVLGWLRRLGYVDDAAFARARARSLLAAGRAGPRLAERRLLAAGIPRDDARRAVRDALGAADASGAGGERREAALCGEALAKRLRGADPSALEPKARARHARFLLGRGFSPAVVARVLRMELAADEEGG
jgi:regulatory protein